MAIDFQEAAPVEATVEELSSHAPQQLELDRFTPDLAVALLIDYAVRIGASDLFFCCGEEGVEVSARHLGIIRKLSRMSLELGSRCMLHIRAAAGLKFDDRRRPQDGRWVRKHANGNIVDLRLNSMPTLHGESFAIRLLVRDNRLRRLDSLGFVGPQLDILRGWLHSPSGLILVTGSTGAGKTTTLYSCLQYLNDGRRKIHTIEDPVEYAIEGLRQSQVDETNGPDFPQLLRSVLRQGPDIIMIGEVRDQVAAETAVQAANSGQLVFATSHAPFAAGAIQTLLVMGVHPHFLCNSLLGVIGQRLVRTLCPQSKVPLDLSAAPRTFEEVQPWLEPGQGEVIYAAGVNGQGFEGYTGRTGVFELLHPTPTIRRMIAQSRPSGEIAQQALGEGMIDFRRAALLKVAQGETSFDEVVRVVPAVSDWIGP